MQIEHLAIWVRDLEGITAFYLKYFNVTAGEKYTNPAKQFTSCFINFGEKIILRSQPKNGKLC